MDLRKFLDGPANTVLVSSVEPGRKIPWTKPEDIDVGPDFRGFGKPGGIASPYTFPTQGGGRAAPFLFAAYPEVRFISTTISSADLLALTTCQGGEKPAMDRLPILEALHGFSPLPVLRVRVEGGKATATLD